MKSAHKVFTSVLISSLSLITACGNNPGSGYYSPTIPIIQPNAPTVRQPALPQITVTNKQPTLPNGKKAVDMRFDMKALSEDTPAASPSAAPTPRPSASTAAGSTIAGANEAPEQAAPQANELNVPLGTTEQFSVEITLDDGQMLVNYTQVNWTSENRNVGTISSSGIFTPVSEGTTRVTASIGGVAKTIQVNVRQGNFIWQQFQAPTQANLYGVKLVSDNEAWAVGAGGTMLHFFQGRWNDLTRQLHPVTLGANIYSIDMVTPTEGWAVGDNLILHLSGGRWNRVRSPIEGIFKSVDMLPPGSLNSSYNTGLNNGLGFGNGVNFGNGLNNGFNTPATTGGLGYIVGESGGTSVVLQLNPQMGWQPMATGIDQPLNDVSAIGPNHVWAVGDTGSLQRAGIYQLEDQVWKKVRFTNALIDLKRPTGKFSMRSIKMVNSTQGWAVGEYDPLFSSVRGKRGAIFRYDSVNDIWTEIELSGDVDQNFEQVTYNDIGMMNPNQGWVLGNTVDIPLSTAVNTQVNGNLMSTDGFFIRPASDFQAQSLPNAFNSIDIVEHGHGILVGDEGIIMHRQYDRNYRYQRGNFGNFNGEAGLGYDGQNTGLNTQF